LKSLRIAFLPLIRRTFDVVYAEEMISAARLQLTQAGFELIEPPEPISDMDGVNQAIQAIKRQPIDLLLIFQATFADSTMITALSSSLQAPLFLWAVPEDWTGGRLRLNSLCGINLAGHALTLRKQKFYYGYGLPQDKDLIEKIRVFATAGAIKRQMKEMCFGVVGQHPEGMDSCHLDASILNTIFGIRIELIDLEEVFIRAKAAPEAEVIEIRQALDAKLTNLAELEQAPLTNSLRVYHALNAIRQERNLCGLAVRCWPEFFTQLGCAACGAMSMMSDGFLDRPATPCGCEADINGTITQKILQLLSGEPAFGTDMVGLDEGKNLIALWHCGLAPLSMADQSTPPRGTIHSNRNLPLLMDFKLKPGLVTYGRLSRAYGGLCMVIGSGHIIDGPKPFSGTSGLLKPFLPANTFLEMLMKEGLEHHISLTYGDFTEEIKAMAGIYDLPILWLNAKEVPRH